MILYPNIKDLLTDYQKTFGISQPLGEETFNVSGRTTESREDSENRIDIKNEHVIAEKLKIPFAVIHCLNADIPVSYNIKTRRYFLPRYSKDFFNKELEKLPGQLNIAERINTIKNEKETDNILEYDHNIYATNNPVKKSVILKAIEVLPELNLYAKDSFGFYAGHLVVFPIKKETYNLLRAGTITEGDLTESDLESHSENKFTSLYINSVYCSCPEITIMLFRKAIQNLKSIKDSHFAPEAIISGYVVTKDGAELATKSGFRKVFENQEEHEDFKTEYIPMFFEFKIGDLKLG